MPKITKSNKKVGVRAWAVVNALEYNEGNLVIMTSSGQGKIYPSKSKAVSDLFYSNRKVIPVLITPITTPK